MQGYRIRHPRPVPGLCLPAPPVLQPGNAGRRSSPRRSVSPRPRSSSSSPATARALLPLAFCRECGQEYYSVRTAPGEQDSTVVAPRKLNDTTGDDESDAGFLYIGSDKPWPTTSRPRSSAFPRSGSSRGARASAYGRTIASTSHARSRSTRPAPSPPTVSVATGCPRRSASASTAGFHTVAARRGTSGSCSPSGPAGARVRRPSSLARDPHAARRRRRAHFRARLRSS